jgi:ribulose-phosphate 3-epimerase
MRVSASILDCDFLRLADELSAIEQAGVDCIHLDVMDGHFVPNLSFGTPIGRKVRETTSLPLHSHLMVERPEQVIGMFLPFSDLVVFHVEAAEDPGGCIGQIHKADKQAGISLNPDTRIESLRPFLPDLQDVLVMSVFPGRGGQDFIPGSLERIRAIREMVAEAGSTATVSVDGGIKPSNCRAVADAGADVAIAGSAIFRSSDYVSAVRELRCSKP